MANHPTEVVNRFYAAYNKKDFEGMAACLAPNLHFEHFNKGYKFETSKELVEVLRAFAGTYMPDRAFGAAIRTSVSGNTVYKEALWSGTLAVDLPGFGKAGEKIAHRLMSVLTVDDKGLIAEYMDYG